MLRVTRPPLAIVTAPFSTNRRPLMLAPVPSVMLVCAATSPETSLSVPIVADDPMFHYTFAASAPLIRFTNEFGAVVSVLAVLKIHCDVASLLPSSTSVPVNAAAPAKQNTPLLSGPPR